MALCSPRLHKLMINEICCCSYDCKRSQVRKILPKKLKQQRRICPAIAIDGQDSVASVSGIRWGCAELKGAREEMEDEAVVIQSDGLHGFTYAAVFDGHAGFSSVQFLRDELYRECVESLKGGQLLDEKNFIAIKKAMEEAFLNADSRLLELLESNGEEDESGSTATAIFARSDVIFISHLGDSSVVLSSSGKSRVLTDSHRPYGRSSVSLQEITRIREAGGWITSGRICGEISVSRAFGDIRFKTMKNKLLMKGVEDGRWSEKFASRIRFKGDLVTAFPDVYQVALGPDSEFIILATDGLWDYINSSDAVNFVRNQFSKHGDAQMASEALAQMALVKGSQDNVTIIIGDFGRTEWQSLSEEKQNLPYEVGQAVATVGLVLLGIWMSTMPSS